MMMNRKLALLFSIILVVSSLFTGCQDSAIIDDGEQNTLFTNIDEKAYDTKNIMNIIEELASEKYKGRLAGTKGNELATNYIANYFKKIGLDYPNDYESYLQYFDQNVIFTYDTPKLEIIDGDGQIDKEYKYIDDFSVDIFNTKISIKGDVNGKAVVLEKAEDLENNMDNYENKILLVSTAVYSNKGLGYIIDRVIRSNSKVAGLIVEVDVKYPNYRYEGFVVATNAYPTTKFTEGKPMLFYSTKEVFEELVDFSQRGLDIHMQSNLALENVTSANVIGVIEGEDDNLKDQFIIIGAHFDHVGDNKNGTYNPGALDNASGTAVMMEIARVIKEGNYKPKKSLLFIAFNGEEEGLYGSKYYANNPAYPLNKDNAVMINLDMVGSKTELPLTLMSFDKKNTNLRSALYQYTKDLGIESVQDVGQGSDHAAFAAKGIDSICLIHMDLKNGYHTPRDTLDKVDEERIGEVTKLVLYYLDKNAF